MVLNDVVVAGIGETPKSRGKDGEPQLTIEEYYTELAELTLDDAGLHRDEVDGFGTVTPLATRGIPPVWPAHIAEVLGFEGIEWMPTTNHGGASPVALFLQAALAVDSGVVDSILCLGAETPIPVSADHLGDPPSRRGFVTNYLDPLGNQGPNSRLAVAQNAYQRMYDLEREQLGAIAVTQREHALDNPLAYFDESMTMDEYLNAPPVADPFGLLDCVMPVNGGGGCLLTTRDEADRLAVDPVSIAGFGQYHNADLVERPDPARTGIEQAGARALDRAGIGLSEIDHFQIYDDYPIMVLIQLEDLGLCERGEGGAFVEHHDLGVDGDVPLNTGGGQLSAGQAGVAGGFVQLLEGVRQLRGEGGDRQVPEADYGLVAAIGGLSYDKNIQSNSVVILEGGDGS